jgi:hypothetical protein
MKNLKGKFADYENRISKIKYNFNFSFNLYLNLYLFNYQ